MLRQGFCLLKFKQFQCEEVAIFGWIVFQEHCEADALRLMQIMTDGTKGINPEREHEIGRLLSYSENQVEAFLSHARRMLEKP